MVFDPDGTLFFAAYNSVRARLPSGAIVNIAGTDEAGFSGDGGPAVDAQLSMVRSIALGPDGDHLCLGLRQPPHPPDLTRDGIITTIAGPYNVSPPPIGVTLLTAEYLAVDASGNLFMTMGDSRIVRLDAASGLTTTVVGNWRIR